MLLAVAIFCPFYSLFAEDVPDAKSVKESIQIVSDRLDVYGNNSMAVFSGNVVATQKDMVINSDELCLYYKEKKENDSGSSDDITSGAGEIDRIEAKGHVRVSRGEKIVTGDEAVFSEGDNKIVITGNARIQDGKNAIEGERITFFMTENRGVVEGSENGRVKAFIYPEDKKSGISSN